MNGIFSTQEPGQANNIVLPNVDEKASFAFETTDKSFCLMAQMCEDIERYMPFCLSAIGPEGVTSLNKALQRFDSGKKYA